MVAGGKGQDADRMAAEWQKDKPKDAGFIYYLGDQALAEKDWSKAEAYYGNVNTLQPRNAAAMNNLAWLLATQHKPGAVAWAQKANALQADSAPMLDTLALAQESENLLPAAIKTQKRAVELGPRDPMLRLRLAQLLIKQGDKSAAREELDYLAGLGRGFAGQAEVQVLLKSL